MKKILICFIFAVMMTVTVMAKDITAEYDVPTEAELQSALRYELVQYAGDYLDAAKEYGINVYFLCAKDALESGWGQYPAGKNNLGSWRLDNGKYRDYDSVSEYIASNAKKHARYVSNRGRRVLQRHYGQRG